MSDIVDVDYTEDKPARGRPVGTRKKAKEKNSFVREGHELDKAIKKIAKEAELAIGVLSEIAANKENDVRVRQTAASDILSHLQKMAESRNKQQMAELIAEFKVAGRSGSLSAIEEDDTPEVNFTDIPDEFTKVKIDYEEKS